MRTKTLLLTAALSVAAAATSMAQAVYSVNIVGYVNKTLNPGYTMICNPFVVADSKVSTLIPVAPSGTTIYNFNGSFVGTQFDDLAGAWTDPNLPLNLGSGFFVQNVSGAPFTITFVGEVLTGTINNPPSVSGYQILSSKVPQAGTLGALGLVPGDGDQVLRFDNAGNTFVGYSYDGLGGQWVSAAPVDPVNGPSIDVGESFFYNNLASSATWTRVFNP